MINLNLRHLEAFVAIAKAGNFTRASQTLHISQPALTVQIRQLEETMGVRLLDRNTRTVKLTSIGQQLSPVIQRLLRDLETVLSNAHDLAAGVRGQVSIAAMPSVCSMLLPQTIEAFRKSHPGIAINLKDVVAQKVLAMVRMEEVDFGIGSFADVDTSLKVTPLFTDSMRVVFLPQSPLAKKRTIKLEDLVKYPLILMDRQSSVRMLIERAFNSIGHSPAPAYEVTYMSSAVGMAKAGLGVAFLPSSTLEVSELSELLSRVVNHPGLTRNIAAIGKTGRDLSPAAASFLKALVEQCKRFDSKGGRERR